MSHTSLEVSLRVLGATLSCKNRIMQDFYFLPPTCCLLLTSQGSQEPFWIYSLWLESGDDETRNTATPRKSVAISVGKCSSGHLLQPRFIWAGSCLHGLPPAVTVWLAERCPAGKGLSDLSALEKEVFSLACRIHLLPLPC